MVVSHLPFYQRLTRGLSDFYEKFRLGPYEERTGLSLEDVHRAFAEGHWQRPNGKYYFGGPGIHLKRDTFMISVTYRHIMFALPGLSQNRSRSLLAG